MSERDRPFPSPEGEKGKWNSLCLAAVLLLSTIFSLVRIFDQDTWFHLAGGRLIWQSGLPAVNTFSHTFPDYPWRNAEWLFDLTAYAFHKAGGIAGVELFQVLLVAAAFLLAVSAGLGKAAPVRKTDFLYLIPLVLLALAASRFRFPLRPHLVSLVGLASLLKLWSARPRRLPLWFMLAGMVWANFHPGVVYGAVLCLLFMLSSGASGKKEDFSAAALAGLAFFAGSLVNPYLLYPYRFSIAHLAMGRDLPALTEFLRPVPADNLSFFFLAALSLAAVPLRVRKGDYLFPMLVGSFLLISLYAVRIIPKFSVVALPGLIASSREAGERLSRRKSQGKIPILLPALFGALALFLAERDWHRYEAALSFGIGVNRAILPEGAADYLVERDIQGRMYNDLGNGGYLVWRLYPARKVFQDGRMLAYPSDFYSEILGTKKPLDAGTWQDLMDRWKVDYAVVRRGLSGGSADTGILFSGLGWPLVYLDGVSGVFVRPGSESEDRVREDRFRLISLTSDPQTLFRLGRREPEPMLREVRRIDPGRLLVPYDCFRFGAAAHAAGDDALAEAFFLRWKVLEPDRSLERELAGRLRGLADR